LDSELGDETKSVNYVGWLGHRNLGDEALYEITKEIFKSFSFVPAETDWQDHSMLSPVTVIGGSTGIPEWFEWLRPTRFNYVFGAGVKDPVFHGYDYIFRDQLKVSVMMKKLKFFRLIGVRGNISRSLLMKWGIQSEVIGDPCLSFRPANSSGKSEKRIAVSIGSDGILWGMNDERVFREVTKVCRKLIKVGYEIILIPFWEKNVSVLKKLAIEEGIDFFDDWIDVKSTLNLIADCKMLIGQKLHSLVFSAAATTPFVGLEYQPKCYDFAESVGFENYMIRTDTVSEKKLMVAFASLIENYGEMREKLVRKVETYRERQKKFAARIIRDIELIPDYYWQAPHLERRARKKMFWAADIFFHKKPELWHIWNSLFFLRSLPYFT
jgi:hypothetical protein